LRLNYTEWCATTPVINIKDGENMKVFVVFEAGNPTTKPTYSRVRVFKNYPTQLAYMPTVAPQPQIVECEVEG